MTDTATSSLPTFPPGFVLGAATSSYQIEGAVTADGRGPSVWDGFSRVDGAVRNGENGDVAIDHYHRMEQDLDLMVELGLRAYRFSVAWPRVQPTGQGPVNTAGLDFYRRLVDGLLDRGIEPLLTLYHWDLPQALEDVGGWAARDTSHRFADYAEVMAAALGDVVRSWSTLNEPWCSAFLGYHRGVHAPGRRDASAAVAAAHHLLLGHGLAVDRIRRVADAAVDVGIVLNLAPVHPASTDPADVEAARLVDGGRNRCWTGPLLHGAYPNDVLEDWAGVADLDPIRDEDLDVIARPLDWLGINYYHPITVAADPAGEAMEPGGDGIGDAPPPGQRTAMGWPVDATGLAEVVRSVHDQHPDLPLWITENGAAFADAVVDGRVDDDDRVAFLLDHLHVVADLVDDGHDIRGYCAWSLFDNFEWALGYEPRFGIVHVDYDTLERTPKRSAEVYREVIRAQA